MATMVTRTVVCDEGLEKCDNTSLVKVQLSVDGSRASRILCPKHAAPFQVLYEKMTAGETGPKRGRVYTEAEIAARRRAPRKKKA